MTEAPSSTPDRAPIGAIRIGERDRTEMGNLDELADSIKAVGLLHPIVVTANLDLVAGGRRLAAVKQLGWADVPVTVVDWFSAELALRAEADENTCRKPLSPIEASRMRERRIKVLTEAAVIRKPGRPAKLPERDEAQGEIWDEPTDATAMGNGSNLDQFPQPGTTAAKARKLGAVTTGFSGSSIDKVDEVRQIAERGTRTVGSGATRREEPVPEPVREIARQQLPALAQTGAAIEPAHQAVRRALDEYVGEDPAVKDAKYWEAFTKALAAVTTGLLTYDPVRIAHLSRDMTGLEAVRGALQTWFDTYDAAGTGGTVTPLRRSS